MPTEFIGRELHYYEEVGSTNDICRELLNLPAVTPGTVVWAGKQTQGRGRQGKSWFAPAGGLWFSLILKPPLLLNKFALFSLIWAVAVRNALVKFLPDSTGSDCRVKWPNDVLIAGRKVSGILLETVAASDGGYYMITGIGINVNNSSQQYPPTLRSNINSLAEAAGAHIRIEMVLAEVLTLMEEYYNTYVEQGAESIIADFTRYCCHIGCLISAEFGDQRLTGVNIGINNEGAMMLDDGFNITKITAGEIIVLEE